MTEPHFSVALPARDVERAGIAARIGPWMGVSAASWPALLSVMAGLAATGWVAMLLIGRVDGLSATPYDLGSLPPFDHSDPTFLERPAAVDRLRRVASGLPKTARLTVDVALVAPLADRAAIRSLVAGGFPSRDAYVLVDRDAWSSGKREAQRRGRILEVLKSSARPILADDGRFVLWGPQPGGGVP